MIEQLYQKHNNQEHLAIMKEMKNLDHSFQEFRLEITEAIAKMPQQMIEATDKRYAPISIMDNLKWISRSLVVAAIGIIVYVIETAIRK
jgi:hypothetical protein